MQARIRSARRHAASAAALALLLAAHAPAAAGAAEGEAAPPKPRPAPAAEVAKPAASDCAAEVATRVQARYDGIDWLRANFAQTARNAAFAEAEGAAGEPSSGKVEFAKPGRMRFAYEKPEPSLVVSDGATLWIYDPAAKEVQVLPVSAGYLSAAAIQFLLGEGHLDESFDVKAQRCEPDRADLVLRPKNEATYERIDLGIERKTGWIQDTTVVDLLGNETHLAFKDIETGTGSPDPAHFRFDPPKGVRVLKLEEPPR